MKENVNKIVGKILFTILQVGGVIGIIWLTLLCIGLLKFNLSNWKIL